MPHVNPRQVRVVPSKALLAFLERGSITACSASVLIPPLQCPRLSRQAFYLDWRREKQDVLLLLAERSTLDPRLAVSNVIHPYKMCEVDVPYETIPLADPWVPSESLRDQQDRLARTPQKSKRK